MMYIKNVYVFSESSGKIFLYVNPCYALIYRVDFNRIISANVVKS